MKLNIISTFFKLLLKLSQVRQILEEMFVEIAITHRISPTRFIMSYNNNNIRVIISVLLKLGCKHLNLVIF